MNRFKRLLFISCAIGLLATSAFATYPAAVTSFTTKTDGVDLVSASHINAMQTDITAIETELGTDPAGSMTDLKSRLAIIIDGYGAIANGTAFPTTPSVVSGQLFFRTDLDKIYRRNAANLAWNDISAPVGDYTNGTTYTETTAATSRENTYNDATYRKIKELSPLVRAGYVTISWTVASQSDDTHGSKLYINDIAVGSEQSGDGTKTESNVRVEVGDVIQVYVNRLAGSDPYSCNVSNLIVKCLNPTLPVEGI